MNSDSLVEFNRIIENLTDKQSILDLLITATQTLQGKVLSQSNIETALTNHLSSLGYSFIVQVKRERLYSYSYIDNNYQVIIQVWGKNISFGNRVYLYFYTLDKTWIENLCKEIKSSSFQRKIDRMRKELAQFDNLIEMTNSINSLLDERQKIINDIDPTSSPSQWLTGEIKLIDNSQ